MIMPEEKRAKIIDMIRDTIREAEPTAFTRLRLQVFADTSET